MDDAGDTREDLKVPDNDLGNEIKAKHEADEQFMVTVLKAMDEECIIGIKAMTKQMDTELFAVRVLDSESGTL